MNLRFWQNLNVLRFLAGLWGWLTIIFFTIDFFSGHKYDVSISGISVIYGAILAFYVGSKEYLRWSKKKLLKSKYFGEIYVIIWTLLMVIFVVLAPFSGGYLKVPGEFTAVYLMVLSVYILSQQSKSLKRKG